MPPAVRPAIELLLIEDDPHASRLFVDRVSRFASGEFNVTQARSLKAGLDEAADFPFGLAVLDLTLPDSTGIATCSKFNAAQPEVPFVVLTGVDDASLVETISKAGAKAALVKQDCSAIDLVNAIRTAAVSKEYDTPTVSKKVSEARFKNAIIDSADGIVVVDKAGSIQLVSSGAELLLGRPAAEVIGSPLGIDLNPGEPVRAQVVREEQKSLQEAGQPVHVRDFDSSSLHVSDIEFWPFSHQWSGQLMTVCAMRDVTNQLEEELKQRNVVDIEKPLRVSAGIADICAEYAARLSAFVKFNRIEVSLRRPELKRLQIITATGALSEGRDTSALVEETLYPPEFGAWLTGRSDENYALEVVVSIGSIEKIQYTGRDQAAISRCATMIARHLQDSKRISVLKTAPTNIGVEIAGVSDSAMPGAA